MKSIFDQLSDALHRALASSDYLLPNQLQEAAKSAASSISPWATWLLFSLVRHEQRQQWVAHVATTKLGADLAAISARGALGHPSIEQTGLVPGLTDCEYYFHGCGCCLTNRLSGETIDVDFHDGSADWFDAYFFMEFLGSLKQPSFVEHRVITLHPTLETIQFAFDELAELGLLERHAESNAVKLAAECREWSDQIDQLDADCRHSGRCIQAGVVLGDWLLVQEHVGDDDSVAQQVKRCIRNHGRRLACLFRQSQTRRLALYAIVDLDVPESRFALEAVLQDPPSGALSAALTIVKSRGNEDWTDQVFRVLRRTNLNGEIPEPDIWLTCAEYLLRKGRHVNEVRAGLSRFVRRELGNAAILALEFTPECALDLFRKALRSSVPCDRTTAAAALAILDRPWSRAELLAVLGESDDQEATAECRAALNALPYADLHQLVSEWETRNPHEAEPGPFITMAEIALRTQDAYMQHEMVELNDRVLPLRNRIVSVPKRS